MALQAVHCSNNHSLTAGDSALVPPKQRETRCPPPSPLPPGPRAPPADQMILLRDAALGEAYSYEILERALLC
jgi:hypothetical protein